MLNWGFMLVRLSPILILIPMSWFHLSIGPGGWNDPDFIYTGGQVSKMILYTSSKHVFIFCKPCTCISHMS